jgi:hypothetical protein
MKDVASWLAGAGNLAVIRSWFGIDEDHVITHMGFRSPLPVAWMLMLVLLAVVIAAWTYWRENRLPRGLRVLLAFLRGVVYVALLWIIFCPFVSLERQVEIRRDVLILLDRSESMSIRDVRADPESLGDAALALGMADHEDPAAHEALLRAQAAARKSCDALAGSDREAILRALDEVDDSFDALGGILNRSSASSSAASVREAVAALGRDQQDIRESLLKLPETGAFSVSRQSDLAAAQKVVDGRLDAVMDTLRMHPVEVPAAQRERLARVPRMDLAAGLLTQHDQRVVRRLAEAANVRGFVFGDGLQPVGSGIDAVIKGLAAAEPSDESTRGGEALAEMVAKYGGQSPAGVVMLTDGAFNEGADAVDVARRMKDLGIPLFTVGIGVRAPRDIGLGPVIVPEVVFPEDKVSARVQVFSSGFRGTSTDVRLLLDDREVAVRTVELADEGAFIDLPFVIPADMAGTCELAVVVDSKPGEQTTANNRVERSIKVIDQKIKVLYVEGRPRWEYRYLRVVLQRDKRLDVKFLLTEGDRELALSSPEHLARYPDNPGEEFQFDLVILGDVPAWYFDRPQMERMVAHVRGRGASLMMLAGENHAPASYANTPVGELLPVRIREGSPELVSEERHPSVTVAGRRSFTGFDSSAEATDALWSLVRPLYSLPALDGAKPGANVLLEIPGPGGGDGHPLLAWHYAGTGKVMFIGTDQLWRLRLMRGDEYHALFWGKAIQFLALSRLLGENRQIRLETDRVEFRTGEKLEIHATVLDDSFQPSAAGEYAVRIGRLPSPTADQPADGQAVTLLPVAGTPGLFHGVARIEKEGRYQLMARAGDEGISNVVDLLVARAGLEMLEPAMQESRLREISELSGGRHLSIRDWPALPGLIGRNNATTLQSTDLDLWDIWPVYLLVVTCAGLEWFIRRRHHLV